MRACLCVRKQCLLNMCLFLCQQDNACRCALEGGMQASRLNFKKGIAKKFNMIMFIKKIHSSSLHHENCYPTGMTTYRVLLGPKTRFLLYFDNLTKPSFLCYHCFFFLDSVQNSIFLVVRHNSIRGYVRPSVGRSVSRSVRWSVFTKRKFSAGSNQTANN